MSYVHALFRQPISMAPPWHGKSGRRLLAAPPVLLDWIGCNVEEYGLGVGGVEEDGAGGRRGGRREGWEHTLARPWIRPSSWALRSWRHRPLDDLPRPLMLATVKGGEPTVEATTFFRFLYPAGWNIPTSTACHTQLPHSTSPYGTPTLSPIARLALQPIRMVPSAWRIPMFLVWKLVPYFLPIRIWHDQFSLYIACRKFGFLKKYWINYQYLIHIKIRKFVPCLESGHMGHTTIWSYYLDHISTLSDMLLAHSML